MIPFAIMASAMMPYLFSGLRVEHIVVPVFAALTLLMSGKDGQLNADSRVLLFVALFVLWAGLAGGVLGSVFSDVTGFDARPEAMFLRLCMPVLMLFSFVRLLLYVPAPLETTARAIVWMAILAGLCAVLSALIDLSSLFAPWVQQDSGSVWENSVAIGRYPGLFNQPLEAGIFYSVALFAQVYLIKFARRNIVVTALGLAVIVAGGMVSFSKNFSLLGVAVALLFAMWINLVGLWAVLLMLIGGAVAIPLVISGLNPAYFDSLADLYREGGILMAISAGRLGSSETGVSKLFADLWERDAWILGRGLGSHLPLDSGYLEYFYQGGVLAITGYLAFLVVLAVAAIRYRTTAGGKLIGCLLVLAAAGSVGGPVITASRASVAFMLLLAAAFASIATCCSNQIKGSFQ
jgi:hypothetical protein